MKPVVILDANALYGRNPFARPPILALLELSRLGSIRLIVPEVVVHEISRQSEEELKNNASQIYSALKKLNQALADSGDAKAHVTLPTKSRMDFFAYARELLRSKRVEVPAPPSVSISDLLNRDLDARKPFARDGKGFRDTLIWETIRNVCDTLGDTSTPVVLVTNNRSDFYVERSGGLHADLRSDLEPGQRFEVVGSPHHAQQHSTVRPLLDSMRALTTTFTKPALEQLVDDALSNIDPSISSFSTYVGEGLYENPISTSLDEATFDEIIPDNSSISHDIFRVGDSEYSIEVTVEVDASLTGFLDKGDYFAMDGGDLVVLEDWNRHVFRVSEPPHRVLLKLQGRFSDATMDALRLELDEISEL